MKPYGLLLLCALALSAWLLWPQTESGGDAPGVPDGRGAAQAPALLQAQETPRAPGLDGLGHEPSALPWGDVLPDSRILVRRSSGRPRVGLPVRIRDPRDAREARLVLTDAQGAVELHGVPYDGSVVVEVLRGCGPGALRAQPVLASVGVTGALHEITCAEGLELHVTAVDAQTGRAMAGLPWRPLRAKLPLEPREACRLRHGPGDPALLGIETAIAPGEGYVAWDATRWVTTISRYAASLRMVYPLRREARVHLRALEHDGTPSARMAVCAFRVGGVPGPRPPATTPDRGGVLLHGIPFFREQRVEVLVARPPARAAFEPGEEVSEEEAEIIEVEEVRGDGGLRSFASGPSRLEDAAIGHGRLPREPERLLALEARFPEDPSESLLWRHEEEWFLEEVVETDADEPRATGAVRVTLRRTDGSAIPGALVSCGAASLRTDVAGRVLFERVSVGRLALEVSEAGVVPTRAVVDVAEGQMVEVELREAPGATLRVRVVDGEGEDVPFASVAFDDRLWVDLVDGVQRIDPYTDVRGRRTFARVAAGKRIVRAYWGGHHGRADVETKDGGSYDVVITVRPTTD